MADDNKKSIDEQNVYIRDTLMSIASKYAETLKDAVEDAFDSAEAGTLNAVGKDLTRSFTKLAKMSDDFANNESRIRKGLLSQKDIEKQIQSVKDKQESLARKIEHARRLGLEVSEEDKRAAEDSLKVQLEMLEADKKLAKSYSGKIALQKTWNDLQSRFNAEQAKELFTLAGFLKATVDAALRYNKTSVEIGKNIGYGKDQANRVATSMKNVAQNSNNVNVTLKNAAEAMTQLNEATGLVTEYSADALKTQIMLTKQFGLTGDEAAGIYKYSILTGKASSQINKEMVGAFVATRNQLRVGVPFRSTIAEAAKISGQLAANLQNNPASIVKAIVQAKALGTTLEQTKKQGESLLNFESSIENELKAELITGQQMNLERARAAALVGDQVAVAQELANQGMTLNKFQNMNVIAQKSFAEALGLSADELAEQLKKQQMAIEQGKSLAQITEEEAVAAQKRQDIQSKFNAAVEKLQDFFGNLLAGPLGQFLEMLTKSLDYIKAIGIGLLTWQATAKAVVFYEGIAAMQKQKQIGFGAALLAQSRAALGISEAKAASEVIGATAMTFGTILPIILGAGATIWSLLSSFNTADDMISPGYGKRTILSPEGAIALNNNDTIVAGTNLGGGGGGNNMALVAAINELHNTVKSTANKPSVAYIQGENAFAKKLGTIDTLGASQLQNTHPFA